MCKCAHAHVYMCVFLHVCVSVCMFMVKEGGGRGEYKICYPAKDACSSSVSTATGKAELKEQMAHFILKAAKRLTQWLSADPSSSLVRR